MVQVATRGVGGRVTQPNHAKPGSCHNQAARSAVQCAALRRLSPHLLLPRQHQEPARRGRPAGLYRQPGACARPTRATLPRAQPPCPPTPATLARLPAFRASLHARLHACTPARLHACTPARLHACTPAHKVQRNIGMQTIRTRCLI